LPRQELEAAITAMKHGSKRSQGSGALYEKYKGAISRRELTRLVREMRAGKNKRRRGHCQQVKWNEVGVCWAIDSTEYGRDEQGKKLVVHTVRELASRYELEPMVSVGLKGEQVAEHLKALFERHGVPLFLKRDNGSNLNDAAVNAVMDEYGVMPLNSPAYWPGYNGARERGIRELKEALGKGPERWELEALQPYVEAVANRLNIRSRRCLKGKNAMEVYASRKRNRFGKKERRNIFEWIKIRSMAILAEVKPMNHRSWNAAWRKATETWLSDQELITVLSNKKCYPLSRPNGLRN
jgi:hypothetical protein